MKLFSEAVEEVEYICEEKEDGKKNYKIRGIFMQADIKNRNGRVYPMDVLQKEVNKIVRLIDIEKGCISCSHGWTEPFTRKADAGHFHSIGSNASLRFNLYNIFKQCSICNTHLSGNIKGYRNGLIDHYDFYILDHVETEIVEKYQYIKLSIDDLKECIKKARQIIRDIEKGRDYSRSKVNEVLGIYK